MPFRLRASRPLQQMRQGREGSLDTKSIGPLLKYKRRLFLLTEKRQRFIVAGLYWMKGNNTLLPADPENIPFLFLSFYFRHTLLPYVT